MEHTEISIHNMELAMRDKVGRELYYSSTEIQQIIQDLAYSDYNIIRKAQSVISTYKDLGLVAIQDNRIVIEH